MSRTRTFGHSLGYCAVSLFLLLSTGPSVRAQLDATQTEVPIQIVLKPDKNTIMLGEPLYVSFEVTNISGEKLCLGVGGDYHNKFGRPDSFNVSVRTVDGAEIPKIEVVTLGGFIGCDRIEPGRTYTVRLFLPHWATIEGTGSYRVNVKRTMGFSSDEPSRSRQPKYSMLADVDAEFTVVPWDENKMGGIIAALGSVMLDISDPRATESSVALASIQDKRVISYFVEALRKFADFENPSYREHNISSNAIAALATYDDDRAIEALQRAINNPTEATRLNVATAFRDSRHKSATKLLLEMQDDPYWFVRLRVAQGLKTVKTKESLDTLQKLLKDKNKDVREAAAIALDVLAK